MNVYSGGSIVVLVIPLTDQNGRALSPTEANLSFVVHDETEGEITQVTPISVVGYAQHDTQVTIVVDATINDLGTATKGMRSITVSTLEDDGSRGSVVFRYALRGSEPLVVGENSYQKFNAAALLTLEMPELTGWDFATDLRKEAAMIEAYNRIGMLRFTVDGVDIIGLNELTTDEFDELSVIFIAALKKAQLSEADIVLGGDPISAKREEGLLSDSVGESAIMFRPGKPLLMSVNRRSLNYLSGFVSYGNRLVRV